MLLLFCRGFESIVSSAMRVIQGRYFIETEVAMDGSCLFSAISHGIYGSDSRAGVIRHEVVDAVIGDWEAMQQETDMGGFRPYASAEDYRTCNHSSIDEE